MGRGCSWKVGLGRDQPLPETQHKEQGQETSAPICLLQMGSEARGEGGTRGGICRGEPPGALSKIGVGYAGTQSL